MRSFSRGRLPRSCPDFSNPAGEQCPSAPTPLPTSWQLKEMSSHFESWPLVRFQDIQNMSVAETPTLPASFWEPVLALPSTSDRIRWYMCVLVTLSSLNYSDIVPQVYNHLDEHLLSTMSPEDRFSVSQKLREGLIKSTGIVGAARTGNAMRALATCIPVELREKESPRSKESDETARQRGKEFWTRIYSRNRVFDPEASVRASPDYAFIIRGMTLKQFDMMNNS